MAKLVRKLLAISDNCTNKINGILIGTCIFSNRRNKIVEKCCLFENTSLFWDIKFSKNFKILEKDLN